MPEPDPDNYGFLVALAWLAGLFIQVFGTAVFIGVRETDLDRAGYSPSWATCCEIFGVATLVFYSAVFAASRHDGKLVATAQRRQRVSRYRVEAELRDEERRAQLYGQHRLPLTIAVNPLLWTVPLQFGGGKSLPKDPVTGQNGADPSNVTTGLLLPLVTLGLWWCTGRLLAAFSVAVWLPWAGFTESGHLVVADVIGFVGIFVLVATTVAVYLVRRQRTAEEALRGISSTARRS